MENEQLSTGEVEESGLLTARVWEVIMALHLKKPPRLMVLALRDILAYYDENGIRDMDVEELPDPTISNHKMQLLNSLLATLPFEVLGIESIEDNCGTVWITLKGGKVYSISVMETEET